MLWIFELKIRKGLKAMLAAGFGSKNLTGEALWNLREEGIKFQNNRSYRRHNHIYCHCALYF